MSVITQHQRINTWFTDWREASDDRLASLYAAGARVMTAHLQDHGEIPVSEVKRWKSHGFRVWGAVRPSGEPLGGGLWKPYSAGWFCGKEKRRLGLSGISCNFENEVQQADLRGERWSEGFVADFRFWMPKLPAQLNTYPIEGLAHEPYTAANFRVSVQTYSPTNPWEWSPEWIKDWCKRVGWRPGYIKVTVPVHKIDGERMPYQSILDGLKAAGIVGFTIYPTEAAMDVLDEYLVPMVRRAVEMGVAR